MSLIALAALSGICGNEPIVIRLKKKLPDPPPEPPCLACELVLSAIAGAGCYWFWSGAFEAGSLLTVVALGLIGGRAASIVYRAAAGLLTRSDAVAG